MPKCCSPSTNCHPRYSDPGTMPAHSLTDEQIHAHLDEIFEAEFTFLKTEEPARILAALEPVRQDYMLT